MHFTKTHIDGLFIIKPRVFEDARGYFFESFNKKEFKEAGINTDFVQDNQSYSKYGTVRGLHFQKGDFAQAKLVRAVHGTILDVAVDIRVGSPTFGQHAAIELSAENKYQLYIPRGFAHGFAVLSDDAIFSYKCDNYYAPQADSSILFNDKELAIDWKIPAEEIILSEKDKLAPTFKEYKECIL